MSLGNSDLFKAFARPALQLYYNNPDDPGDARQPAIMDTIIQYLLNRTRLEVSLVRITDATKE